MACQSTMRTPVNAKDSLTTGVNESSKAGEGDRTLDINLGKVLSVVVSCYLIGVRSAIKSACSIACTSDQGLNNGPRVASCSSDRLTALAADIANLPEAGR